MEKEQIRRQIWDLMEERSTARFPETGVKEKSPILMELPRLVKGLEVLNGKRQK